jgi:hypothetical protein
MYVYEYSNNETVAAAEYIMTQHQANTTCTLLLLLLEATMTFYEIDFLLSSILKANSRKEQGLLPFVYRNVTAPTKFLLTMVHHAPVKAFEIPHISLALFMTAFSIVSEIGKC